MPVVKTKIEYSDLGTCILGKRARVFLRHHPNLTLPDGGAWVITSSVIKFLSHSALGPVFETHGSIYQPFKVETILECHEALKEMEAARKTPHHRRTWGFTPPVHA